ncbi:hypothetical protein PR048_014084 [Dryococelus australis]|uniref:Uncharacterized protein n=1 Tax=Dryococelus australis TaxID=614101 RepID=A0ABQ9HU03_9NEOP|nr:hypothetical protein PR048_014084 [Dryococelus australis]
MANMASMSLVHIKRRCRRCVLLRQLCRTVEKLIHACDLLIYGVRYLGVRSICHKFLIKGHTHNEGYSAHLLIER